MSVCVCETVWWTHVGGLKSALEDGNGVILSCDIAEILWPTT
jgi:hypothetical protein